MRVEGKVRSLGKLYRYLGLLIVLVVNVILGFNPDLAEVNWSLKIQAVLVLADWIWPVVLLPKMEWQDWHDAWALSWLLLVVLEAVGMGWLLVVGQNQSLSKGVGTAAGFLILRVLGIVLMRL